MCFLNVFRNKIDIILWRSEVSSWVSRHLPVIYVHIDIFGYLRFKLQVFLHFEFKMLFAIFRKTEDSVLPGFCNLPVVVIHWQMTECSLRNAYFIQVCVLNMLPNIIKMYNQYSQLLWLSLTFAPAACGFLLDSLACIYNSQCSSTKMQTSRKQSSYRTTE